MVDDLVAGVGNYLMVVGLSFAVCGYNLADDNFDCSDFEGENSSGDDN